MYRVVVLPAALIGFINRFSRCGNPAAGGASPQQFRFAGLREIADTNNIIPVLKNNRCFFFMDIEPEFLARKFDPMGHHEQQFSSRVPKLRGSGRNGS